MNADPLREAARLGPYFVWEARDGDPGWRPLRDLLDPRVIEQRVTIGRRTLAGLGGLSVEDIEERAAASIIFLGLAARLLSPLLGAVATTGALPVADLDRLWWRPVPGGPIPIACHDLGSRPASAGLFTETAVLGLVAPILDVFHVRYRLSLQVLWGDVASALGGAAGMIADQSPDAAQPAADLVSGLLARPPLHGTATLNRPDPTRARWFLARNNCCLYYRIPGGGTCGDCVLNRRT
ncbi:MAG TPA: (2Fe-2S)-binding protein [Actinoplanes sp.]|nr:(2Fe-2S)-binding protein [Actinoplanes sp.]